MSALLALLQKTGFDDRSHSLVSDGLQQVQLRRCIRHRGIAAAHTQRTNGFCARIEWHAHPGVYTLHGRGDISCLALTQIILCQDRASLADDLLSQTQAGRQRLVFTVGDPLAVVHTETIVKIIGGFVIKRHVKQRGRDDLRRLGENQFQNIVEGQRDVHTL